MRNYFVKFLILFSSSHPFPFACFFVDFFVVVFAFGSVWFLLCFGFFLSVFSFG